MLRVVPEVIDRLHKIAMGQGDTKPVVLKDGSVVDVEQVIPAQAQVNACNSLLDRFGLTAVRLHQHQVSTTPPTTTPAPTTYDHGTDTPRPFDPANPDPSLPLTREQALAMTPDQRRQWEEQRRQRQAG